MEGDYLIIFVFFSAVSIICMASGVVGSFNSPYSFEPGFLYYFGAVLLLITLVFLGVVLTKEEVSKE